MIKTKKISYVIIAVLILTLCMVCLSACFRGAKTTEYTVTFNGSGGELVEGVEVQKVKKGEAATAPVYTRQGYIFDGWDKSFNDVNRNLTVNAKWKEDDYPEYTVTFVGSGGQLVEGDVQQQVKKGQPAVAPVYEKNNYLLSWDKNFDNINQDITVTAIWTHLSGTTELEKFWTENIDLFLLLWDNEGIRREDFSFVNGSEVDGLEELSIKALMVQGQLPLAVECVYEDIEEAIIDGNIILEQNIGEGITYARIADTNIIAIDLFGIPYIFNNNIHVNDNVYYSGDKTVLIRSLSSATEYTVLDGTQKIQPKAFNGIEDMVSIAIPKSVRIIGEGAFFNCSNLSEVSFEVGSNLEFLGEMAFGNSGLNSIVLPQGLETINQEVFHRCKNLFSIILPSGLTEIGIAAFYGCDSLEEIKLPNSLKTIREYAFMGCESLSFVYIPQSVETIEESLFMDTIDLAVFVHAVAKPESWDANWSSGSDIIVWDSQQEPQKLDVLWAKKGGGFMEVWGDYFTSGDFCLVNNYKGMGIRALMYLTSNDEIAYAIEFVDRYDAEDALAELNEHYMLSYNSPIIYRDEYSLQHFFTGTVELDNDMYISEADNGLKVLIRYIGFDTTVSIPSRVLEIGCYAFKENTTLESIIIPDNIVQIGQGAFLFCMNLQSVEIAGTVSTISRHAFNGCFVLNSIILNEGIETIGAFAFGGCAGLEFLILPSSVTVIETMAFAGCAYLEKIYIPENVEYFEEFVFGGQIALTVYVAISEAEKPETWAEDWNCGYQIEWESDVPTDWN